jgi:hypothetical protein
MWNRLKLNRVGETLVVNKLIQQKLVDLGLLDPPADGVWGVQSRASLTHFQELCRIAPTGEFNEKTAELLSRSAPTHFNLGSDLASKIVKKMLELGYWVSREDRRYNIIYLEGCDADGTPNSDRLNEWNDRRILLEVRQGTPRILRNWLATTEPGRFYTQHPLNAAGAFRIAFGQYQAWKMGYHGSSQYPALVQCAAVVGHRDGNKDGFRTGDVVVSGDYYGINQHHGWGMQFVDESSAGCLVGQSIEGHQEFINLLKTDRRYQANQQYQFYTTVLDATKL